MRLATLKLGDGTTAAVLDAGGYVPVAGERGERIPDVGALLRRGRVDELAAAALAAGTAAPFREDALLRPVLDPGAVICVGLNFRPHILEMGHELPTAPTLFSKLPRALTDPFAPITVPAAASAKPDYEGELGVVIGRSGRDVSREQAWSHVAGLTVVNDVSMRDYQWRTPQWFAGKTWEGCTPVGPWVVTLDEVGELGEQTLRTVVNGEVRQQASLGDLVFDVPDLIADVSKIFTLRPGDIIATGTPGGVGSASERFLADGDEVTVEISGVGAIANTVRVA